MFERKGIASARDYLKFITLMRFGIKDKKSDRDYLKFMILLRV